MCDAPPSGRLPKTQFLWALGCFAYHQKKRNVNLAAIKSAVESAVAAEGSRTRVPAESTISRLATAYGRLVIDFGVDLSDLDAASPHHAYDLLNDGVVVSPKDAVLMVELLTMDDMTVNEIADAIASRGVRSLSLDGVVVRDLERLESEWGASPVQEEGDEKRLTINSLERVTALRSAAVRHHGTTCMACGFSFKEWYGTLGENFIEVHHLHPLSRGPRETDPVTDMVVLCSNCHRMIHRDPDRLLTVDELRAVIDAQPAS